MKRLLLISASALLFVPQLSLAQDHDLEAQLRPYLAPPELVMRYQMQLNITVEQRQVIRQRTSELQSGVLDLQWDLQNLNQELVDIVTRDSVDVAAAIAQLDRVLEIEAVIKRSHMRMLLEIRNILNPEQRRRIQELIEEMASRERHEEPLRRREPDVLHHYPGR